MLQIVQQHIACIHHADFINKVFGLDERLPHGFAELFKEEEFSVRLTQIKNAEGQRELTRNDSVITGERIGNTITTKTTPEGMRRRFAIAPIKDNKTKIDQRVELGVTTNNTAVFDFPVDKFSDKKYSLAVFLLDENEMLIKDKQGKLIQDTVTIEFEEESENIQLLSPKQYERIPAKEEIEVHLSIPEKQRSEIEEL